MPTTPMTRTIQRKDQITRQADLLEKSITLLSPRGETVAARFYEVLLFENPRLRPLFEGVSMAAQYRKLWTALVLTVQGYRHPEQLSKILLELGLKHRKYGVNPEDYRAVRVSLMKTLKEFLDEIWSDQLDRAWSQALGEVSKIMLKGSEHTTPVKDMSTQET